MKNRLFFSITFVPLFLMVSYTLLEDVVIEHSQRSMNTVPAFILMGVEIVVQGIILFVMYRSFVHKKEKNYRILLVIMIIITILLFFLSTSLIIPFQLYTIFPFLTAYYGSAILYSLFSK